jgi:hypothetical protein
MIAKTSTRKRKQLSRGQRTHVRRMKQEARKANIPDSQANKKSRPVEIIQEVGLTIGK